MIVAHEILRAHAAQWVLERSYDPEAEQNVAAARGIVILTRDNPLYPDMLRLLADPPEVLYVRGTLPLLGAALAVVGSRRASLYGRRMARRFACECAAAGIPVVSGLARGIDSEAHKAALEGNGMTWAVLGSGLDRIYPPEHADLSEAIVSSGGALLSEIPLGGPPVRANFPKRNRILAGLSWGTVVVEGDFRSGSLITAKAALEQGREVFAVPGPADSPLSAGPHELIRQGARIALTLENVLEEVPALRAQAAEGPRVRTACDAANRDGGHTLEEEKILKLLGSHSLSLEELIRGTGLETASLLRLLVAMEAKDMVSPVPGQRYARI